MLDGAATEFLSIPDLLKATPRQEGADRFIYFEASNEAKDQEGEVVLAKALQASADYYLRYGNVDIDHVTIAGPKRGIADYNTYEVGRPVEVKFRSPRTFVKAQLYRGDGPMAAKANEVWDSLTKLSPPARWYPSVGGAVTERGEERDSKTGAVRTLIKAVRWVNVALSRTPVNQTVPTISTVPFGALCKSWGAGGLDLRKALEAGYGTDSAALSGGAALRRQSLDGARSYFDFRDRMAGDIRRKRVRTPITASGLVDHAASEFGLAKSEAADWCERFLADVAAARKVKVKQ